MVLGLSGYCRLCRCGTVRRFSEISRTSLPGCLNSPWSGSFECFEAILGIFQLLLVCLFLPDRVRFEVVPKDVFWYL